jgi:hypothetical protein
MITILGGTTESPILRLAGFIRGNIFNDKRRTLRFANQVYTLPNTQHLLWLRLRNFDVVDRQLSR